MMYPYAGRCIHVKSMILRIIWGFLLCFEKCLVEFVDNIVQVIFGERGMLQTASTKASKNPNS